MSVSLNGDLLLQDGLAKALETKINQLNKIGQFVASFSVAGAMPVVNKKKPSHCSACHRKVLNDMVKHSGAQKTQFAVSAPNNLLVLLIRDKRVEFDATE